MNALAAVREAVRATRPIAWENPYRRPAAEALAGKTLGMRDVRDAEARWMRFAPLLARLFPETGDGVLESPFMPVRRLSEEMKRRFGVPECALFAKCDNALPVAGSIKARGGIYEVLATAERIALERGVLQSVEDDYLKLAGTEAKDLFSQYEIAVGSTGNLGLSIGISASALGFAATVHMSADAKEWKKSLLRARGVNVVEHAQDYSAAVAAGRAACSASEACHFVDDERSVLLFLGYSAAALRLERQLRRANVTVDAAHPLSVFLPCGVGGAPGGIAFGLKCIFGDAVRCFFVEPTHAPCMLLAMLEGTPEVHVRDVGIDGVTEADGLAVGSPSAFVYSVVRDLVDGFCTVDDAELHPFVALAWDLEGIKIEPSAAAAFAALRRFPVSAGETAVAWLTGGDFVPEDLFAAMVERGRRTEA